MDTKALLIGISSFIAGGLLVSVAATTFGKNDSALQPERDMSMSMNSMSSNLHGKSGDEFDRAFLSEMIGHHQGAIDMANQAKQSAKHDEIKELANDIVKAQTSEIHEMQQWQEDWGYYR